jgi:hypothetical protein
MKEAQQVPSVMLEVDAIQQPLVVLFLETPPAQALGESLFDPRGGRNYGLCRHAGCATIGALA